MGAGDQLGQPGGAAGEEEYRDTGRVRRDRCGDRALGTPWFRTERGQVLVPNVLAGHQDVVQGRRGGQEFLRHLLVVEAA